MDPVGVLSGVKGVSETLKRVDILSLGIVIVKEIRERSLNEEEIQGLLMLIQNLLKKENLL